MVGVGIDGKESSLARVSVVNFYGALQLDVFVRQRERVVGYRTEFSGIRPSDMIHGQIIPLLVWRRRLIFRMKRSHFLMFRSKLPTF